MVPGHLWAIVSISGGHCYDIYLEYHGVVHIETTLHI